MAITKPILPAIKGYVEVDVDEKRVYKEVATGRLFTPEELAETLNSPSEADQLRADVDFLAAMTGVTL